MSRKRTRKRNARAGGKAAQAGKPSISAVLPAYNEEENIRAQTEELRAALRKHCEAFEIIIVDDGSLDSTPAIADSLDAEYPEVRVIHHKPNEGYGAALRDGFLAARMPLVFYTDSDRQFVADEIGLLIGRIGEADIVTGYRADRQDPRMRKFFSWGFKKFIGMIFGVHVRDCDCAFKLYRREIFSRFRIESKQFFVDAEVLAKANMLGCIIDETPVTHKERAGGQSTVRLGHILSTLREAWHMFRNPGISPREPAKARTKA